tara:strand:- start:6844 stop:6999 length:156 start_codon:yes stop_codon:yes gene_type:complete
MDVIVFSEIWPWSGFLLYGLLVYEGRMMLRQTQSEYRRSVRIAVKTIVLNR